MPVFGARAVETGNRASAESLRLGESGDTGRQQGADGESGRTLSAMAEYFGFSSQYGDSSSEENDRNKIIF